MVRFRKGELELAEGTLGKMVFDFQSILTEQA
jgi:hypothetical protein